jgi:hypothetical protein
MRSTKAAMAPKIVAVRTRAESPGPPGPIVASPLTPLATELRPRMDHHPWASRRQTTDLDVS